MGTRWSRLGLAALTSATAVTAVATSAQATLDGTALVSRAAGPSGAKGNAAASEPALPADGRYVAFASQATNLHPDDTDAAFDVFLRDLQTHAVVLASRATGATGASSNADSRHPAVSADGRYVAFMSEATNLHPDDTDSHADLFVRDLHTDTLVLASRAAGASGAKGDGPSHSPAISADGRFVAFVSQATNLGPDETGSDPDVFVRDLHTHTLELVSRAAGATGAPGNIPSLQAAISGDGRFVAFTSHATNLHPDDTDVSADVFVRDRQTDDLMLASRAVGVSGASGNGDSVAPAISPDGGLVAFNSTAPNLHPDDSDPSRDVFVRDLEANTIALVSRAAGANGAKSNGRSVGPTISADGRSVAFDSEAGNLHPDDPDTEPDVFVRDLQTGAVELMSRAAGAGGAKANGFSADSAISGDGRNVAYVSGATNLHPDDTDATPDVFVRHVSSQTGPGPSPAPTAAPPPVPGECANGVDDDRDGWTDAADPQCAASRGQEGPPDNPVLTCARAGLVLTDVLPAGRRVRIAGFANPALAGRDVLVYAGTRRVGRARVKADGSYTTTVPRRPQRYQTRVGDLRSRALKLDRKTVDATIAHRDGTVTLKGRVIAKRRRGARVELMLGRPGACDAYTRVARRKLPRHGRFAISAPAPTDRAVAVYRARIRLRDQTTYTLPRVIFLR